MFVDYASPFQRVSARVLLLSWLSLTPSLSSGPGSVDVAHSSCGPCRGAEAMQLPIYSYILFWRFAFISLPESLAYDGESS